MTDYNVFALRARLARVNRTEDRPIDGPPLIEFEWDDDSPVTFRDLATLDAYVQEAIAAAFRKRDEALAAVRERDEALAAVERVRALADEWVRRHNEHHRGQSGWPDLAECPDCADVRALLATLTAALGDKP